MTREACYSEDGYYTIVEGTRELVRLPVVTVHAGVTVCEFTRIEPAIPLDIAIAAIRRELLAVFLDDGYRSATLELVDLDRGCWARVPYDATDVPPSWTAVLEDWPPEISTRSTALAGAPRMAELALRAVWGGHRFVWTAACASPDRRRIATVHGAKGTVWLTDLATGAIEKLPPIGAPIFSLAWGAALVAIQLKVAPVHAWTGAAWEAIDLGTGPRMRCAWSPDGRELAVPCLDGHLRIYDWASRTARLARRLDPRSLWGVAWSRDGRRLAVGHNHPAITIVEAADGAERHVLTGTQHFQGTFAIGPRDEVVASLAMKRLTVYDAAGLIITELPNAASHGLNSGGFLRDGTLVVECYDGAVHVWDVARRQLLAIQQAAPKEPIVVLDDAVVLRCNGRLEIRGVS